MNKTLPCLAAAASVALLAACGSAPMAMPYSQAQLPDAVKVPAGHQVALETVGSGEITYECRAKAGAAETFEWAFVGPQATLADRAGKSVGRYYGPPATWEAHDQSKLTGTQLAVAPATPGNLPLQLVKANPATGSGAMSGITFVQRVATQGGTAPAAPCTAQTTGAKQTVNYRADYIFWKAA